MNKLVSNIAELHSGHHLRHSPVGGNTYYIQSRHFNNDAELIPGITPELIAQDKFDSYLLRPNDILIAAKGSVHFAGLYSGAPSPAIASSVFIVVRVHESSNMLPGYVAWYINQPAIQHQISLNAKGTSLPSITKVDVGNISVPARPLESQKKIVEIASLGRKRSHLLLELNHQQNKLIQQQLYSTIK